MVAAKISFGQLENVNRIAFTKVGYPVIEITKKKIDKATQRIIGFVHDNNQTIEIDTYEAIITDSETEEIITKFQVTRDAFAVNRSNAGEREYVLTNFAFEPKDANIDNFEGRFVFGTYYPNGHDTPAIKFYQRGSEQIWAHPNEDAVSDGLNYRIQEDIARGIMLHVGGYYFNESVGTITVGASEGCFAIVNEGNSISSPSDDETIRVMNIITEMATKSTTRPNYILIKLRKREEDEIPNKLVHHRT